MHGFPPFRHTLVLLPPDPSVQRLADDPACVSDLRQRLHRTAIHIDVLGNLLDFIDCIGNLIDVIDLFGNLIDFTGVIGNPRYFLDFKP